MESLPEIPPERAEEDSSPTSDFTFDTKVTDGEEDSASGGVSTTGEAETLTQTPVQMQVNATGGVPPPDVNNPAGAGEPQSLPEQGINLTSPVEFKSRNSMRSKSASFSWLPFQEQGESQSSSNNKERLLKKDDGGLSKKKSFGIYPRGRPSNLGPDPLDEVLGSQNLLKNVEGRSSPVTSAEPQQPPLEESISLKRVPSYRTGPGPDLRRKSCSKFEPERRRATILSLDGGGMRGLIGARILAHLESLLQSKTGGEVKLCDYFDFLAGTSTGALLMLMISTPDAKGEPLFTGQSCCQFYARNGKNIFRPRWFDPWRGTLRQWYRPKYSPRRFERLLKGYLVRDGRALTMRDTLKPFLVTSFDISRATPHIFVRQAAMKDDSRNFNLWEVCRGTASAPTYFRPAEVVSIDGTVKTTLIDGGAIQNNPALVAMTHVLGNNEEFPEAVGLQDVLILSIGAGQLDEKFELQKAKKWGLAGWVRPLLNIMMDGSSDTIDYQLAAGFAGHDCSENYLRIQVSGLPKNTSLMDCSTRENINDLIQLTDDLLQENAVMRNEYGEKVIHKETYAERLSWFADQLIHQKKLREQGSNGASKVQNLSDRGIPMTSQMISPLCSHLFLHHQLHHNGMSKPLETAKSVRF
ncbi:unnamed protein product [Calypogeia fissa]